MQNGKGAKYPKGNWAIQLELQVRWIMYRTVKCAAKGYFSTTSSKGENSNLNFCPTSVLRLKKRGDAWLKTWNVFNSICNGARGEKWTLHTPVKFFSKDFEYLNYTQHFSILKSQLEM